MMIAIVILLVLILVLLISIAGKLDSYFKTIENHICINKGISFETRDKLLVIEDKLSKMSKSLDWVHMNTRSKP